MAVYWDLLYLLFAMNILLLRAVCLDFTLEWSFCCRRCCYEFPVKFLCLFCTNYHFLFSFCLLLPALLLFTLGIVFCFGNCRNSNSSKTRRFGFELNFIRLQ